MLETSTVEMSSSTDVSNTSAGPADVQKPKTVNIVLGFFFMLNFVVGTGFLSVPYAFFSGGLLVGVATLLVVSFVAWNCAIWEIEVMARAQAVVDARAEGNGRSILPYFRIEISRKFEPSELCEVFVGRWLKIVYLKVLTCYTFLACLSFSTVAGSAWAVNIPFNFSGVEQCSGGDFGNHTLPVVTSCRNAYWFCLFLFACIVVPLSLVELKEQVIVQVALGLLRFVTIGAIVIFSVANLAINHEICSCNNPWDVDNSSKLYSESDTGACNLNYTDGEIVTRFTPKHWLGAIPVFVYAHILHQGIPSLTHPIKQKQHLWSYFTILFIMICFLYILLGVTVSLWFKDCTAETSTLIWALDVYKKSSSVALVVLSYYIILFPSLDVVSVYPLLVLTIVDNLYSVLFCQDVSQSRKTWTNFFIRLIMKFVVALGPILVAMAVSNLVTVLKFAGLLGFFICFFFPSYLQVHSQWVCSRTFPSATSIDTMSENSTINEKLPLIPKKPTLKQFLTLSSRGSYMTPYSGVCSYWPVVLLAGLVGIVLLILTIVSIFV